MADIVPVTAQVICAAVFETGHSKSVWTEMNSEVGQTVIRPRGLSTREESVGLFDQAKISQRSEADVRADNGPVHRATRREHPRHARKALLVLDARETINFKEQAGTLWRMVLTTWQACLCSNLGLASTLGRGAEVTEKK